MTTRKYSSRSQQTTLTGALTSSGTSATVVSGTALLGGVTISAGETFTVVIDPDTALEEIVDVTAVSTNTLTITRGVDGSTGQAHSAGAVVRHMAIGRDFREANTHIEATTGHGATGAVVGTTNTQTLTNKTISAADNTLTGVVTLTGTQTLTNKTLTSPVISSLTLGDGNIVFEGATADAFETTLTVADPTADRTVTIPDATTTLVGTDTTQTLTNKTLTSPTITGTGTIAGTFTGNLTGNVTGSSGSTTGNAATATALATGRTFQLTGDVEASGVTFDGTGNVSLTTVIGTGAIVNADVNASAAIAKTKLDLGGTITSADLVDGTIVATDIADGTITAAKMVSDPYARANHTGTQAASTISDFDTQVRTSRLDQMAAPTGSVSANSQKITSLGTPTSNADAATKLYVDTKVADLVNSAPSTLDTLGEIATAIQAGGTVYDSFVLKAGSTMTGALTLSGAPTVDLHAATKAYVDTVAGSATAAAASATAAAASYDSFDDRYLGSKSSAPSVDNDGNALITGALYWNSVSNAMFAWTGSAWGSISSTADIFRYRYTASGGETSESGPDDNGLTLSYIVGKEQVYLNGVLLVRSTDYVATNGTSIASLAALTAGDILEIITFTPFEVANVISPTVIDAKGDLIAGTSADTIGKLTVGSNGQYLSADSATATGLSWVTPAAGYSAPTIGSTSIASGATVSTIAGLTLTSPTINTATASSAILVAPEERTTVSATAATGTVNFDAVTQGVLYYTTNASANWTLNVRGSSSATLDSILATGDAITVNFLVTNGSTAYRQTAFTIDGTSVTPKYSGGTAPAAGNASSIDVYTYTIIKTASATYTVFGAGPIKYA
jgi:hypothetical protein